MTRSELVAFLNKLEDEHPVNDWWLDGARIWPLIRQKIGEEVLREELPKAEAVDVALFPLSERLGWLLHGMLDLVLQKRPWSGDTLLYFSENDHLIELSGAIHDKFADPWIRAMSGSGKRSLVIEHLRGKHVALPRAVQVERIDISRPQAFHASLFWRLPKPTYDFELELGEMLDKLPPGQSRPSIQVIRAQVRTWQQLVRFYSRLFRRRKPRAVFLVCWYSVEYMALCHVCSTMGIPCIDLQHGIQGHAHLAYGTWSKVPSVGYSLMPSVFWCWDASSATHINNWAQGSPHVALHLGSPWMEWLREGAGPAARPHNRKDQGRKRVLYTAEPLPDLLPTVIIEAMKATKDVYQWLVRPHPTRPSDKDNALATLAEHGLLGHVNVSAPAEMPLFHALDCDVHVTQYSSVILDAAMHGVPSISIDPHARDIFKPHLGTGTLKVVDTVQDLLHELEAAERRDGHTHQFPPLLERIQSAISQGKGPSGTR